MAGKRGTEHILMESTDRTADVRRSPKSGSLRKMTVSGKSVPTKAFPK
jgi:hypothetical protein